MVFFIIRVGQYKVMGISRFSMVVARHDRSFINWIKVMGDETITSLDNYLFDALEKKLYKKYA